MSRVAGRKSSTRIKESSCFSLQSARCRQWLAAADRACDLHLRASVRGMRISFAGAERFFIHR